MVLSSLQYVALNTFLSNALKHLLARLVNLKLKVLLFRSFVKTPCPLMSWLLAYSNLYEKFLLIKKWYVHRHVQPQRLVQGCALSSR